MKLTHLSNQRVIISRLMTVSGSKMALTTVTAALGHLQPMDLRMSQYFPGVPGKMYVIWLDVSDDVQEGDQLKDEDHNIYTVVKGGVTRWRHGAMDYKEVRIVRTSP